MSKGQKSVSPIHQQNFHEEKEDNKGKYDINYFVSHLAGNNNQSNWYEQSKIKDFGQSFQFQKRNEPNLQNYETFGKSAGKNLEF